MLFVLGECSAPVYLILCEQPITFLHVVRSQNFCKPQRKAGKGPIGRQWIPGTCDGSNGEKRYVHSYTCTCTSVKWKQLEILWEARKWYIQ